MNSLWIPSPKPPHLSEDAQNEILNRTMEEGLLTISRHAWVDLEQNCQPFGDKLKQLGDDLKLQSVNCRTPEIEKGYYWDKGILKIGAAITHIAYRSSGYFQEISDGTFYEGAVLADMGGEPDSYFCSTTEDPALEKLVDCLAESRELTDSVCGSTATDEHRYALLLGAGFARHYLQQSL